jgi:hypothetical protein
MKTALALVVAGMLLVTATAMTAFAASKTNQVSVNLVPPKNPAHQYVYKELQDRRVVQKLQEFLSPFRLPRPLKFSVEGCDGEDDATYGDDKITMCYEYIDKLFKNMPAETTPAGIAPIDTVVGPFFDTSLHEFAHALFDMHELPVLGREEDAADRVAAYIYLQLGREEARRLITGTAYAHFSEAKSDDSAQTVKEFSEDFAEEHGTPEQRAYNVLCIAYGADPELFGDVVTKGYLPEERADSCAEEYEQVQDAYEVLIGPHIDHDLEDKILDRTWLREATAHR